MNIKKMILGFCIASQVVLAMGRAPAGLKNIGSNCFMNAALQSLTALETFTNLVRAKKSLYQPGSIGQAYLNFLARVQNSSAKIIDPSNIISRQGWTMMGEKPHTQQDAEQFMMGLLNYLIYQEGNGDQDIPHRDILELFNTVVSTDLSHNGAPIGNQQQETMIPLSLPVQAEDRTLEQCVHHFFGYDEVDYALEETNNRVRAEKRFALDQTGRYLIIGTKQNNGRAQALAFPLTDLDLSQYFRNPSKDQGTYDLRAIVMHSRNAKGGHYISYITINDRWYLCNDARITPVSAQAMQAIAQHGHGPTATFVPTICIYELSHLRRAALTPEPETEATQGATLPAQRTATHTIFRRTQKRTTTAPPARRKVIRTRAAKKYRPRRTFTKSAIPRKKKAALLMAKRCKMCGTPLKKKAAVRRPKFGVKTKKRAVGEKRVTKRRTVRKR